MSDATKQMIRRYYKDVWEKGNAKALDDLLTDDYVDHNPGPGEPPDKKGAKEMVARLAAGWRDAKMDVQSVIVEGDNAAAHWTMEWTQVGNFMGMPADGKRLHLRGHDFYRIKNGRIAEIWHIEDFAGLMGEMGMLPGAG
jgi:steroid delta-isomerase-like uncharacterized protein